MTKCHHKNIVGLYEDSQVIDCIYVSGKFGSQAELNSREKFISLKH